MRMWNVNKCKQDYFWGMFAFLIYSILWILIMIVTKKFIGDYIYYILTVLGLIGLFFIITYEL